MIDGVCDALETDDTTTTASLEVPDAPAASEDDVSVVDAVSTSPDASLDAIADDDDDIVWSSDGQYAPPENGPSSEVVLESAGTPVWIVPFKKVPVAMTTDFAANRLVSCISTPITLLFSTIRSITTP